MDPSAQLCAGSCTLVPSYRQTLVTFLDSPSPKQNPWKEKEIIQINVEEELIQLTHRVQCCVL